MAEASQRQLKGVAAKLLTLVAVLMSVYHILYVSRIVEHFSKYIMSQPHRAATVSFTIILALFLLPMKKGQPRDRVPWYDYLLMLLGVAGSVYLAFFWPRNLDRYALEIFYPFEHILALFTVLAVLEITRRAIGLMMPLFALLFVIYMFTANYFPGFLRSEGASIVRASSLLMYSSEGLYGLVMDVASTVIIMFTIFSAFLFVTPAGQFFIDLSMALFGHVRGGPAKVAVVASSLFGTMSGSAASNVVATGTFTIPMMKRIGYKPSFAGAVEAVASTGGQIMPPVMGAAAFVMAQWLGISYWAVCVAAAVPAIFYYLAIFLIVDEEAQHMGLHGLPRNECPSLKRTLKEGWTSLLPLVALIFFMAVPQYSAERAVLYALLVLIVVNLMRKKTRPGLDKWISALKSGGTGFVIAGTACATAGITIGALTVTQLGVKLSDAIVTLSGGHMFLLLLLTALLCYILGMGMPTVSAYVMVVVFVAPALLKLGVLPLAAHLFVFYFAITAFITPPVAVAAFVAASIAAANPVTTGFNAMKLGIVAYAVPFMFVYNQALLLQGPPLEIVLAIVTGIVGVTFLAQGVGGYGLGKLSWGQRISCMAGGIMLMVPGWLPNVIGVATGGLALACQLRKSHGSERVR